MGVRTFATWVGHSVATAGIVVAFAGEGLGADLGVGAAHPAFAQQARSDAPAPVGKSTKPSSDKPASAGTMSATPAPAASAAALSALTSEEGLSAVELLGKRLFEDTNLSEPRGQACASCHEAGKAFTGNAGSKIDAVAAGAPPGVVGNRNVPTAMYARFAPPFSFVEKKDEESGKVEMVPNGGLFLDGRADTLAKQAEGPFLNTREMNNPSKQAVVDKVRAGGYADLMRKVFGEKAFDDVEAAYGNIAVAIAAFESTPRFQPFSSKFDAFLRGEAKLTAVEARGFELFKDPKKGNCLACHVGKEDSKKSEDWLFTDYSYDAFGVPRNRAIPDNAKADFFDKGICDREGLAALAPRGVEIESFCGAFKVPTLRNVAVTAPYMHNGVFKTLREAVDFYATRDTDPKRWYARDAKGRVRKFDDLPKQLHGNINVKEVPYDRKPGERPRLSNREIDAVVKFLETLTDAPYRATAAAPERAAR
jgi:cytochrome c peroxidase